MVLLVLEAGWRMNYYFYIERFTYFMKIFVCTYTITMMNFQNYLQRNKDIVNNCKYLIACPYSNKEQFSSGVWSTIRYAKKLIKKYYYYKK